MNYIIDCGFSTGVFPIHYFRGHPEEDPANWTVFGFEPDERWQHKWPAFHERFPTLRAHIAPAAVWTEDGEMRFFPCKKATSSYMEGAVHRKLESGRNVSRMVTTVDLDRVLRQLQDPEQIVLKMDIEGGEFYVLPHIQRTGSAELLTHAYIEYHARFNRPDWIPILEEIKQWWADHPEIQVHNWR